jgi:hypothetical protein
MNASNMFGGWNDELLEEVRQLGVQSAATVVERFARLVNGNLRAPHTDGQLRGQAQPGGPTNGDARQALDLYLEISRQLYEIAITAVSSADPPSGAAATDGIELTAVQPGETAYGTLWIHSGTGSGCAPIELLAGPLLGTSGDLIGATDIALQPPSVTSSSTEADGVRIIVNVPASVRPGRYRGYIVVRDRADDAIAIALSVTPGP